MYQNSEYSWKFGLQLETTLSRGLGVVSWQQFHLPLDVLVSFCRQKIDASKIIRNPSPINNYLSKTIITSKQYFRKKTRNSKRFLVVLSNIPTEQSRRNVGCHLDAYIFSFCFVQCQFRISGKCNLFEVKFVENYIIDEFI